MKKIILAVAVVLALGFTARAQTNVSHSITSTVNNLLSEQATREATSDRPIWSKQPTVNDRQGYIYVNWDSRLDGTPTSGQVAFVCYSNALPNISGKVGQLIRSNTVIYGYTFDVVTAANTATQNFSLGLNAAGDLLALNTNFGVVQRRSARINPAIKATNDVYLLLSTDGGGTVTGEVNIILDAAYMP